MTKWEYKTVNIMPNLHLSSKALEKEFKPLMDSSCAELGEEGWELVSVISYDAGTKFILFFKRPIA